MQTVYLRCFCDLPGMYDVATIGWWHVLCPEMIISCLWEAHGQWRKDQAQIKDVSWSLATCAATDTSCCPTGIVAMVEGRPAIPVRCVDVFGDDHDKPSCGPKLRSRHIPRSWSFSCDLAGGQVRRLLLATTGTCDRGGRRGADLRADLRAM